MKFADYSYQRPDFQTYQDTYTQALQDLKEASSLSSAKEAVDTLNQLRGTIDTAANLASIRYSIDTNDHFYEIGRAHV